MTGPRADRPDMPGYGVLPADATFAVRADQVIALTEGDLPGSPTRWTFPAG
jgi:hypothetical protein